jgi:hypothetical protein
MGQIMAFWFWQRPCRARPVLWLWNECRKGSQQWQLAVYCRRRESKMEIPALWFGGMAVNENNDEAPRTRGHCESRHFA